MYDIDRLTKECDTVMRRANCELDIPVKINGRLTRTLGRFIYDTVCGYIIPSCIEFSRQFLETATDESIYQTILHECAHYIAALRDPFTHHGHDSYFKEICAEIGCYQDKTKNHVDRIVSEDTFMKYVVICPNCGTIGGYSRMCTTLKSLDSCRCKKCGSKNLSYKQNF